MTCSLATMEPYTLSAQLTGHEADVRSIAAYEAPDGRTLLLSGSRDQTARLWVQQADGTYTSSSLGEERAGFVNAVAFAHDDAGRLYALTGGQDALINAYEVALNAAGAAKVSSTPRYTLIGHQENVCALSVYNGGEYIVSGSWDTTVCVWRNWERVATLRGHSMAVWSVLPLDAEHVLSASADKNVHLWTLSSPERPAATFTGSSQPVRALARLDEATFASSGNDGVVRTYPISARGSDVRPTATLPGQPSFVYALAALQGAAFASSGEDHTVRIWAGGELAQTIVLPAISVWCVCALQNGDVACGSSDGVVRVFTQAAARRALSDALRMFEESVAAQPVNPAEIESIGARTVEGRAALQQAGRPGETLVVQQGAEREVYQWCGRLGPAARWTKVGQVVQSAGASQKKVYNCKEYDYVFDVDVSDDAPPLKLPFNASENPYVAAQRFLENNQLPATYLDQVVQFLERNTQAVGLSAPPTAGDPFTGEGAYVPSASASAAPAAGGASRAPAGPADPFTGAGGITAGMPQLATLPQREFLVFLQANLGAALGKVRSLAAASDSPASAEEVAQVERLGQALGQHAPADATVLGALLERWPAPARFPLLDLLRLAAAGQSTPGIDTLASQALIAAEWDSPALSGDAARRAFETNSMLALRAIANGFHAPGGAAKLGEMALEVLATLQQTHMGELNKNGRIALATIVYNYSVLAVRNTQFGQAGMLLALANEVLAAESAESEVAYRALVAAGNTLSAPAGAALPSSTKSRTCELSDAWRARLGEERIRAVCEDIARLV